MADKEIIIDGIDVRKCIYAILPKKQCPMKSMFYAKETSCIACKEHNTKRNFCKNNPNCYYKQLKRKEQALDEIEKNIKAMNNECFYDDICDCNNCDMKNGCSYYRKFKILNIINKVKEK
jgi:hypothetical protein|nr:MAG TPA: hypothetical protein [Caudoviricetes sp.]